MTKRAFVCRVKPHGADLVDQALAENRIYSGLHRTPDLLNPEHTKESIELTIKTEHPKERNYPPKPEAEMFWIFSRTMQEGDLVLVATRKKDKTIYFIGRVAGDAYHAPEHYESRTTYRRPVRWLNNKVPVGIRELSSPLYQHMNYVTRVQKSFLDISEFVEEIALLVDPNTDDGAIIDASDDLIPHDEFLNDFEAGVAKAMADSSRERLRRIKAAPRTPDVRPVLRYEYVRNHDVVAETLFRANGICGKCGNRAPFNRRSGAPYLEVHHIVQLAHKGEDVLENTIAVCPNCHREVHYGPISMPG